MKFPWGRASPSAMRPLRIEAARDCARIHAAGFAYPWSVAEFESLIAGPTALGAAALDPASGKLRGFVLSRLAADEAEILTIAVDPALRRAGVGRDLLRAHLGEVTAAGAARMFLEVDENNAAARALYARFGFTPVGRREGYYKTDDGRIASALTLRLDLS